MVHIRDFNEVCLSQRPAEKESADWRLDQPKSMGPLVLFLSRSSNMMALPPILLLWHLCIIRQLFF